MKIILAIGSTKVEEVIQKNLPSDCKVVGIAPYREAVLTKLEAAPSADILLIRDNLKGTMPILKLLHQVRINYSNCRIVLLTKQREAGDLFLSEVVSMGIWDVIIGSKSSLDTMLDYIKNPRTFKDIERYQIRKMMSDSEIAASIVEETEKKSSSTETEKNNSFNQMLNHFSITTNRPTHRVEKEESTLEMDVEVGNKSPLTPVGTVVQGLSLADQKPIQPGMNSETNRNTLRNKVLQDVEQQEEIFLEVDSQNSQLETPEEVIFELESDEEELIFDLTWSESSATEEELIPLAVDSEEDLKLTPKLLPGRIRGNKLNHIQPTASIKPHYIPPTDYQPVTVEEKPQQMTPSPKEKTKIKVEEEKKFRETPLVLSVVGARGGVGTTSVALNLAIQLAQSKNNVLYVELDDVGLPFSYLYQLGNLSNGLEVALAEKHKNKTEDFSSFVHNMRQFKKSTDKMLASVSSKYPNTFNFLAFSQFFNRNTYNKEYYPECLQEVLTSLLSKEFHYIILDVNTRSDQRLVKQAYQLSNHVIHVINQNLLSVGESFIQLTDIHNHKGLDLTNKISFIVNRYQSSSLKTNEILKWSRDELPFVVKNIWTIPEEAKAYQRANDEHFPILLCHPPTTVSEAFQIVCKQLKKF